VATWLIPNEGKTRWLDLAIGGGTPTDTTFDVKLFQNNYTPTDSDTSASYTEATFTGYASVSVARSTYAASTIGSNIATSVSSATPTFTCTGGSAQTIYGAYVVGHTSGKVFAAVRFDNARTMANGSVEVLNPLEFQLKTF
jgi:hypothetical protein